MVVVRSALLVVGRRPPTPSLIGQQVVVEK
jgi:hypothetical protein